MTHWWCVRRVYDEVWARLKMSERGGLGLPKDAPWYFQRVNNVLLGAICSITFVWTWLHLKAVDYIVDDERAKSLALTLITAIMVVYAVIVYSYVTPAMFINKFIYDCTTGAIWSVVVARPDHNNEAVD